MTTKHQPHNKRDIDQLFGSGTRIDILTLFLRSPNIQIDQRTITNVIHRSLSDVQRNLKILINIGLVETSELEILGPETGGVWIKSKDYKLNMKHPWVPALRMLIENAVGSLYILRQELKSLDGIEVAFVFGSFATSEQTPESDIDLMVIGSHSLKSLTVPISKVEENINRVVNYIAFSPEEWKRKYQERDHFVTSVLESPKLFLVADNQKLETLTLGE